MSDPSQRNKTKIEIYYLDKFVPTPAGTLTAGNFTLNDLSISDITVDALGNIFVTD